jgi:hypothetical protein
MLIRYRDGSTFEAIVLLLEGAVMRLALKDAEDVLELRLVRGTWLTEDGEPVTFDFTLNVFAAVGIVPPAEPPADTKPALARSISAPSPQPRDYLN